MTLACASLFEYLLRQSASKRVKARFPLQLNLQDSIIMKSRFYIFHFYIDIRTKGALAPSVSVIKAWGIAPGFNGFFNP